ncbi:sigma-70 family RNA polymerase sigma factor [Aureibaculum sp. 2210JD6-5]|uniref:RNA polymerase sigma factor n=1 Tax=Aureibaculum sp. 2210JD6-5 TaxID=3103957 RepID=UPI002AAE1219|nr:sigma-70 family RNA polymerase sigma factor [Aureibaculum sp. 2210JD6-5]MDY7395269.1 sigma-70 family RNA polymerase sigma factor [Aureibaculum sp. 2210JD6-5]
MTLEESVIQFQKKDVKAFEHLYNNYKKSLLGVIFTIVKDDAIAEEILQDAFIKAWNNADSYNSSKGRFFTWMLNISRNAAIDKTRSKNFKNSQKNQSADNFVDILETYDNLDATTNSIGIKKFVDKLAEKCKDVIHLLYFKGYTQKEASETLKMPLGTIKTRNRNCINELRNIVLN